MVLIGPGCKLQRCGPIQARVWPFIVIVDAPSLDDLSGMVVAGKQMLIPQATVEALDEAVLHGLAGLDIMSLDLGILAPLENSV